MYMKKAVILLAFALLSASGAFAQDDKMLLNHLSLGATAGIDGVGVELAIPASLYVQIRAGYTLWNPTLSKVVDLGVVTMEDFVFDLTALPLSVEPWKGGLGKVLLDFYMEKESAFHITAGAFIGSGRFGAITGDFREVVEEKDYCTGVGMHDWTISTDEEGFVHVDAAVRRIMPYIGIGSGRALDMDSRVSFTYDLGVAYSGGIKTVVYDYSFPNKVRTYELTSEQLVRNEDGKALDEGIVDKLAGVKILPVFRLGMFIRLF